MRRPLPNIPHGPRRARSEPTGPLLLACPRLAPDWEFAAIKALLKPQTAGKILHRSSSQHWPKDAKTRVESVRQIICERLHCDFLPHFPDEGDFYLVLRVLPEQIEAARAFAVLLSRAFPATWLKLDRLYIHDGKFFRRKRNVELELIPATAVHLSRPIRAALRGAL